MSYSSLLVQFLFCLSQVMTGQFVSRSLIDVRDGRVVILSVVETLPTWVQSLSKFHLHGLVDAKFLFLFFNSESLSISILVTPGHHFYQVGSAHLPQVFKDLLNEGVLQAQVLCIFSLSQVN